MESGWDDDVKAFLVKIINSISWVLIWMIASATAGLYFHLGEIYTKPQLGNIIFYLLMITSLIFLVRHLYKIWKF